MRFLFCSIEWVPQIWIIISFCLSSFVSEEWWDLYHPHHFSLSLSRMYFKAFLTKLYWPFDYQRWISASLSTHFFLTLLLHSPPLFTSNHLSPYLLFLCLLHIFAFRWWHLWGLLLMSGLYLRGYISSVLLLFDWLSRKCQAAVQMNWRLRVRGMERQSFTLLNPKELRFIGQWHIYPSRNGSALLLYFCKASSFIPSVVKRIVDHNTIYGVNIYKSLYLVF